MLSVTQPAVTVLLRQIEECLGVRLFDRSTRALRRTDAAHEAYGFARRALAELEAMGSSMADYSGSRKGRLRIAATSTTAQTVLPNHLRQFASAHPEVKLAILDCGPNDFVDLILNEHVDCGVGTLETSVPGLDERVVHHDALVAVAVSTFFESSRPMSWKQLANYPVIAVKPGYGARRQIDQAALAAGVKLRIEHEVSLLSTAMALTCGHLGVAIVPGSIVPFWSDRDLVVRKLLRPHVERKLSFIYKRDRTLPPVAESFLHQLVSQKSG